MTRTSFYLDTRNIRSIDVHDVDLGNPGMGGTEYMFFLIAKYLARTHDITMYVTAPGLFPEGISCQVVRSLDEALAHLENRGPGILVLRESDVLQNARALEKSNQKIIVWAHNYSGHRSLRACVECPNIVRYLCVSREQYEHLRDEAVFAKADYVFNAVVTRHYSSELSFPEENNVFYMGSLIESKGFHVLARQWKDVVAKVPDAKLHVIGSGRLYDRGVPLGPLGIASPEYERCFVKYISKGGKIRDDVIFHGPLGTGKTELMKRAKVAVANPTGKGETFCITALEFGLLGIPVVTKNLGGPRNVVVNGQTGILYDHDYQLTDAILALLTNNELRRDMGRNAMVYAREHFDIEVVMRKWERILQDVQLDKNVVPEYRMTQIGDPRKRLKEWNRRLKSARLLRWLPSIDYWTHALTKKKNSWIINPFKKVFLRRNA